MELYKEDRVRVLNNRVKGWRVLAALVAGLTLAGCILCCCLCTTATAARLETIAVLTSMVGGWIVIFCVTAKIAPYRQEWTHEENVLTGEAQVLEGPVSLEPEVLQIPRSIAICKVVLGEGTDSRRLSIRADKAGLLRPFEGKKLRLTVVSGYISAFEELK